MPIRVRTNSRSLSVRRRLATLFLGVAALGGGLLTAPGSAAAEAGPETMAALPASTVDTFKLVTKDADWTAASQAVKAVEDTGAVTKVTPLAVATSRQHVGRAGLCHATGIDTKLIPDGFCWDKTDDVTNNYDTVTGGWMPQGLTASHDSVPGGTVGGKHLYAVSWHYGKGGSKNEFARVSIADNLGGTAPSYGHVLLVVPSGTGTSGTFTPVKNTHADGMVWYGNRLFVANGGELQVYDMRHLWRVTNLSGEIGVDATNKTSSARWHQWAMPMIGRYDIPGANTGGGCTPGQGTEICLSSLSLDRSSYPDALVSAEHVSWLASVKGARGRVARWPLNADVALPKADDGSGIGTTTASAAYTSPVWAIQGIATDGTYYYTSGTCPDSWWVPGGPPVQDPASYNCIHRGKANEAPHVLTRSPRLTQNLSYAPNSGRLWGTNESMYLAPGETQRTGDRVVFSVKLP
ncbi:hypothetical protein ACFXOQ_11055 [Streptomyces californicus]|uniref:hypothetical protein n=1 Tax=Streptomyces californicus TaxID=67351 RepID=UPI003650EBE2